MATANVIDECSIGKGLFDQCHSTEFTKFKGLKLSNQFSEEENEILRLRSGLDEVETVCLHHEKLILSKFESMHGRYCCDPFERHTKFIKSKI